MMVRVVAGLVPHLVGARADRRAGPTSSHEADVVTTVEPCAVGARLTETFTGWLPAGPGRVVDGSGIDAHGHPSSNTLSRATT